MNKAMLGAMKAGYQARQQKKGSDANPYRDTYTAKGNITFARAFRRPDRHYVHSLVFARACTTDPACGACARRVGNPAGPLCRKETDTTKE